MEPEEKIDVDGLKDPHHNITYIGKATKMEDGTWRCLANVEGELCLVEVNLKIKEDPLKHPRRNLESVAFTCSFCGKSNAECEVIIAGPTVNICNECVEVAQYMIEEHRARKTNGTSPISFVGHVKSNSPCETCRNCIPSFNSVAPWWKGTCTEGLGLKQKVKTCPLYINAEWKDNKSFEPSPGEFSGCRCPNCPEREGSGECKCCAERREEEKNFK